MVCPYAEWLLDISIFWSEIFISNLHSSIIIYAGIFVITFAISIGVYMFSSSQSRNPDIFTLEIVLEFTLRRFFIVSKYKLHDDASNGNIFRVTGPLLGESNDHRWIPLTKATDAELFFDLRLNKRLSKQTRRRWFEIPSRSSWRHCK